MRSLGRAACWLLAVSCGCAAEARSADPGVRGPEPLAVGEEQVARLCGRPTDDLVTDAFCHGAKPRIRGFEGLREMLGLASDDNSIYQGFVLNGHSTSLVTRSVSAINPRIIVMKLESDDERHQQEMAVLAFARGETFSEILVRNRLNGELQFYLVVFTLACEEMPAGCLPGDLLTEAVESGWTSVNVYGEEDLQNTPRDCRTCHQPDGPGTRKFMRMQEFEPPWNHWHYRLSVGGHALLDDYYAAKGDEPFAGYASEDLFMSQPGLLSAMIRFGGMQEQPNAFVSRQIEDEVVESAARRGGDQPVDNSVPGQSETWRKIYERARKGEAISVPYHDVKVTDPGKLAAMTRAYVDYRQGRLARAELPDIRDVYPDDPTLLANMGRVTEPGLDGKEVLLQACSLCHNQRLDRTLSRSRFDVDLSRIERAEKDRAIARVSLPPDDPSVMPPALVRQLSEQGRQRLIELLER